MNAIEFARVIAIAFHYAANGATVTVEPWHFEMPKHVLGGRASVMTIPQGHDRYLVVYDPKLMGSGLREYWVQTAFHEACHVGLNLWGTEDKKQTILVELEVGRCAERWMENVHRARKAHNRLKAQKAQREKEGME